MKRLLIPREPEAMNGMNDDGHPCQPGRQPPDDAGFRTMGMDNERIETIE